MTTHVFDGSDPHLAEDALFGVKPELVGDFRARRARANAHGRSTSPSSWREQKGGRPHEPSLHLSAAAPPRSSSATARARRRRMDRKARLQPRAGSVHAAPGRPMPKRWRRGSARSRPASSPAPPCTRRSRSPKRRSRRRRRPGADCVVSLGGGSTTGLGKAIAYRTDLPQIVDPDHLCRLGGDADPRPDRGRREDHAARSPNVLPEVVIYDPELTLGLPVAMSVTSGLNAMAHAAEGLYAQDRNPITTLMAVEGLRALHAALPAIVATPRRSRSAQRRALRRLALRHGARHGRHGAAPQALPHARRHLRHAACRDPCDHAAAHGRLQCAPPCRSCSRRSPTSSAAQPGRALCDFAKRSARRALRTSA